MSDDAKRPLALPTCKFVDLSDPDERNDILFQTPRTIDDWKASVTRCMQIVEARMDDIEKRILATPPVHPPRGLDEALEHGAKTGLDETPK